MRSSYAELANKQIKYGDDIYYLNYGTNFELWINYEMEISFDTIDEVNDYLFKKYMDKSKEKDRKRVYIYTAYFNEIYKYYYKKKDEVALTNKNYKENIIVKAFQVYGGITYKEIKYYLGTDAIDETDPKNFCELINKYHSANIKRSFNGVIREMCLNEDMKAFGNERSLPEEVIEELYSNTSLSSIVYSQKGKEFENVYCYDFDSAYISKYFSCKYPVNFKRCNVNDKRAKLLKLRITNIKAKNANFCCVSLADRKLGKKLITPTTSSKRILMAEEVVLTVFWFELDIINTYYTYDKMVIEKAWIAELKELPKSFRDAVFKVYSTKEQAKINNIPYADKKVLLNRIHGFFLSKHDVKEKVKPLYQYTPVQVAYFTIALQRYLMIKLIEKVGLENVVSAHTDSIKTIGCYDTIVKEWNEKTKISCSETLGQLEFEGVMEKVVYFSNTRAKYIMDGEFHIKHGGIWSKDAQIILNNYTYDTLNRNSIYGHTVDKTFDSDGDRDRLKCLQERRIFSEVDGNEE